MNGPVTKRRRDAVATRTAILAAAEQLFAARGYRATTLHEIGAAAGFSRGTPGYLFGSKAELYAAVVDAMLARADAFLLPMSPRDGALPIEPEGVVQDLVASFIQFLAEEPNFVRLVEFESGERAQEATGRILALFARRLARAGLERRESAHLAIAIATLCSFPLLQSEAVASALRIDLRSRNARARYEAFVTQLLAARAEPPAARPNS